MAQQIKGLWNFVKRPTFADDDVVVATDSVGILADIDLTGITINQAIKWNGSALVATDFPAEVNDLTAAVTWANVPNANITQGSVTQHQGALSITESQISDLQAYLTAETNDLSAVVTWANVPDANITQTSVTQHEAALTITESQISDLQAYLTAETNDLSAVVTWASVPNAYITEASVTQHEAALSITESQISDLQAYALDADVVHNTGSEVVGGDKTFSNDIIISGDLTVNGTTTTVNTTEMTVSDNIVTLNYDEAGVPTQNAGIEIERGTSTNSSLLWNEGTDKWTAGLVGSETEISLVGHTHVEADITDLQAYLTTEVNDLTAAVTWANVPNVNITQGSVTQHQASLSITESQISDLGSYAVIGGAYHDGFSDFVAQEHIRWDLTGAEDVHADRVTQGAVTQHEAALTITESQISDLQAYITGVAWGDITGTLSNQTDLQSALNGKSATGHTHVEADITDLGSYEPAFSKNTGFNKDFGTTAGTVAEGDHTHAADHTHANKAQLDLVTDGDHDVRADNPHSVTQTQVGLGNVDNTSDANKPVSTAQQTALNGKSDTGHGHTESDISDLGNYAVIGGAYHDGFSDFVANEHVDHSTVSISGGTSLAGGGDITANRTLTFLNDEASPGNNHVYGTNSSGVKGWYASSTTQSGGVLGLGEWEYESGTGTPPADKKFRFNHASPVSATKIFIDYNNDAGNDMENFLASLGAGSILYAQDKEDSTRGFVCMVSGYTDKGAYAEYDITDVTLLNGSLPTGDKYAFVGGISLSHTHTEVDITDLGNYAIIGGAYHDGFSDFVAAEHIDWSATGAEDIHDDRIAQTGVTQHEAALTITESQISDLGSYSTTGHTHTESDITDLGNYSVVGHAHAAADITSGAFADLRISQSSVTQHEAALTITESQISDLGSYSVTGHGHVKADISDFAHTHLEADITDLQAYLTAEVNDLTSAVTWANVPNANITQGSVTQHEAALTITESQISDLQAYALDSAVVHDTGDESIGGNKTFSNNVIVSGNLTINGTTTSVNTEELTVDDNIIVLNNNEAGTPSQNAGIEVERGTSTNASLLWNEGTDKWTAGIVGSETEISLSGHTHVEADITDLDAYLTAEVNDLTAAVTWANVPDANITQGSVTQHEAALTITESQISDLGTYETAFSKNTAFNKDFGSGVGTVCQGNDARLSDARTPTAHTHVEADITDLGNYAVIGGAYHDGFSDFVAAEHIDWSVTGAEDVHADRVTQGSVTQHQAALSITESQISDLQAYITGVAWGDITGTLSNQTDLQSALNGKSATGHGHVKADISDFAHTHVEADITDLGSYLTAEVNDLTAAVTWANVPDANITQGSVTQHEAALSITESQISDFGTYETAFSKNTGFNKDFGTGSGTVCQGNDARLSDARTPTAHTHVEADITDLGNYAVIGGAYHDGFSDFVANEHIDHTTVSITGTNSVSGGGTIAASRTLSLVNDAASPGNDQVYGTNGSGVKGWKADPAVASALGDLTDVTITTPATNEVLSYTGSGWENQALAVGAVSTTLNSWTLDSGDLYYADYTHSLGTTDVAVFMYDSSTLKLVEAEDVRVTDTNTIRVWVRGNAESIKCNVVTGSGPQGPAGPAADNEISLEEGGAAVTNTPHGTLDFDGDDFNVADNGDGSATITANFPADPTKVYRLGHTWAISGEVKVASGDTDFLLPFFISLASGQTAQVVKARYVINSGTNCNVKIQKNGGDLTGFTGMVATTTAATTAPTAQSVTEDDKLALVVNSVSGTPTNLSFTLFIEYTQ